MSLVAYDYSSGEGSDQEEDEETGPSAVVAQTTEPTTDNVNKPQQNGSSEEVEEKDDPIEDEDEVHLPLPAPKKLTNGLNVEEEEDDEFLRKKAIPAEVVKPLPKLPLPKMRNGKVQITIPSLRDFKDDDGDKPKAKPVIGAELPKKGTGLLGMLPRPKSEVSFTVSAAQAGPSTSAAAPSKPIVNRLIPDSVANRPRNVYAEQKSAKKPLPKKVDSKAVESDDSDDEKVDFFSLNKEEALPEISANEINAMVAKRAARMAETVKKFENPEEQEPQPGTSGHYSQMAPIPEAQAEAEDLANERALASLIGGNKAKRARLDEVNIIDISSSDIVPTKEDFLRRKLQEETGFVPTGHLTGDWSCTSKRKSHITYLASKAADNAQELEAMWSSNRQSRRQTQSKYGF